MPSQNDLDQVVSLMAKAAEMPSDELEKAEIEEEIPEVEQTEESTVEKQDAEPETETDDAEQAEQTMAEELGLDKADIYAMKVPLGDGREPISLGDMKDAYIQQVRDADKAEQTRIEQERTIGAERAAIQQLLSVLPELSPDQQQAIHQAQQAHLNREIDKTLARIPDWQDQATYKADMTAMQDLAQQYGISDEELGATVDSRHIHLLRDFARLQAKVAKAEANKPEELKPGKKSGKRKPMAADKRTKLNKQIERAKASKHMPDKVDAITNLLLNS